MTTRPLWREASKPSIPLYWGCGEPILEMSPDCEFCQTQMEGEIFLYRCGTELELEWIWQMGKTKWKWVINHTEGTHKKEIEWEKTKKAYKFLWIYLTVSKWTHAQFLSYMTYKTKQSSGTPIGWTACVFPQLAPDQKVATWPSCIQDFVSTVL